MLKLLALLNLMEISHFTPFDELLQTQHQRRKLKMPLRRYSRIPLLKYYLHPVQRDCQKE